MQLNSVRSRLHPRAAPVRASPKRRLSAEYCVISCERLTCVSFEVFRLLLSASRLLRLTCRCLHELAAGAGSTYEPSRSLISSASLARGTHHHVLDLDDFINELNLSNLRDSCDFWKLLQHRVSSTTGHQRSLNGRRMAQFSAPWHLWRLSLRHDSTFCCCGGFCQSCGEIRLDHLEPSNDSCALPSPP